MSSNTLISFQPKQQGLSTDQTQNGQNTPSPKEKQPTDQPVGSVIEQTANVVNSMPEAAVIPQMPVSPFLMPVESNQSMSQMNTPFMGASNLDSAIQGFIQSPQPTVSYTNNAPVTAATPQVNVSENAQAWKSSLFETSTEPAASSYSPSTADLHTWAPQQVISVEDVSRATFMQVLPQFQNLTPEQAVKRLLGNAEALQGDPLKR